MSLIIQAADNWAELHSDLIEPKASQTQSFSRQGMSICSQKAKLNALGLLLLNAGVNIWLGLPIKSEFCWTLMHF